MVQVTVAEPAILQRGDCFVIRNSSDDRSVGGGKVIDPFPLHHRKRTLKLVDALQATAQGDISEILFKELRATQNPVTLSVVAKHINGDGEQFYKELKPHLPSTVVITTIGGERVAYLKENYSRWQNDILSLLSSYEEQHSLNKGINTISIAAMLGLDQSRASLALVKNILLEKKKQELISQKDSLWFLVKQKDQASSTAKKQIKMIDDYIRQTREHPVTLTPIISKYQRTMKATEIKEILFHLVKAERVVLVNGVYVHKSMMQKYLDILEKELTKNAIGLSLPEFRDVIGQGRKFAELILEIALLRKLVEQDQESLRYKKIDI